MPTARILDATLVREFIADRQRRGIDRWDEVWDGVYVVPPLASNPHQFLATELTIVLHPIVKKACRGHVLTGANVSDRRDGWEQSFRCPDVVVVLPDSRAVDCTTHWLGGPDFLIEIQSPGDDTDAKVPFYALLGVRELLIIHRDTRHMRLLRHDGRELLEAGSADDNHRAPLTSAVVPVRFQYKLTKAGPRTVVQEIGKRKTWTV